MLQGSCVLGRENRTELRFFREPCGKIGRSARRGKVMQMGQEYWTSMEQFETGARYECILYGSTTEYTTSKANFKDTWQGAGSGN